MTRDKLEAELMEQARLNGMGAERELALRAEVERLREGLHLANGVADLAMKHRDMAEAEVERLRTALREARQYVSDAGDDEDPETATNSQDLLAQIDAILAVRDQ